MNSVVDFGGEFYTEVYGDSQGSLDSNDDVDYSNELVGVFVGPKECEMVRVFLKKLANSNLDYQFPYFYMFLLCSLFRLMNLDTCMDLLKVI